MRAPSSGTAVLFETTSSLLECLLAHERSERVTGLGMSSDECTFSSRAASCSPFCHQAKNWLERFTERSHTEGMHHAFGLNIPQTLAEMSDPRTMAVLVYDMQVGIL